MKTNFSSLTCIILFQLLLVNFSFGQNCAPPVASSECTAPSSFDYTSVKNGNWTDPATWGLSSGGPSVENINNQQIKIIHQVLVQNNSLKLDNNSVILITGGGELILRNGSLYLEDGNQSSTEKLLISNGTLRTSGNVQQNGSNTVICAIGASMEIGDELATSTPTVFTAVGLPGSPAGLFNTGSSSTGANFQNKQGYRRLENVCLNVTEDMQNDGGTDELISVCAEIGDQGAFSGPKNDNGGNNSFDGDDGGNFQFQSSSGTNTKIYDSEFYIPSGNIQNSKLLEICNSDFRLTNGSFQNQSGASITTTSAAVPAAANQIVIWINNSGNGTIQNAGTWATNTIKAWRVDAQNNNPSGFSPNLAMTLPEASAASIKAYFNCVTCAAEPCPTTGGNCERTDCNFTYVLNLRSSQPELVGLTIFNDDGLAVTTVTFTLPLIAPADIPALLASASGTGGGTFTPSASSNATNTFLTFTQVGTGFNAAGAFVDFEFTLSQAYITAAGGIIPVSVNAGSIIRNQSFNILDPACINLLPVELLSFTGSPSSQGIDLKWNTASEKNNDRFEIERSTDGKNFEKIGSTDGKGTTSASSNYRFLDKQPAKGVNYYRLNQVDYDGANAHSKVVKISTSDKFAGLGVQLIPNPCADMDCSILLQGVDASKTLTVEMKDLTGRTVFSQQIPADQASFNLPKSIVSKGVYILSAKNGENVTIQKVIIQ